MRTNGIEIKDRMTLHSDFKEARAKLMFKLMAFSEAYIFVLEAQSVAIKNFQDGIDEDFAKSIQGSYVRLEHYLKQHEIDVSSYYRSILFVDLISSVELFFVELIKAVIKQHPNKVGGTKFELKDLLDGISVEEFIERSADGFIHRLMYEKPEDYLSKFCGVLSIEPETIKPYWSSFIEAKARRDVGVHNNWICNDTYLRKIHSSRQESNSNIGDNLIPGDKEYCSGVSENIMRMADKICELLLAKYTHNN